MHTLPRQAVWREPEKPAFVLEPRSNEDRAGGGFLALNSMAGPRTLCGHLP